MGHATSILTFTGAAPKPFASCARFGRPASSTVRIRLRCCAGRLCPSLSSYHNRELCITTQSSRRSWGRLPIGFGILSPAPFPAAGAPPTASVSIRRPFASRSPSPSAIGPREGSANREMKNALPPSSRMCITHKTELHNPFAVIKFFRIWVRKLHIRLPTTVGRRSAARRTGKMLLAHIEPSFQRMRSRSRSGPHSLSAKGQASC